MGESICILALIVVLGFVNGTGFGTTGDALVEGAVSLILLAVMVLPLLMLIYEVIQICRHSETKQVSKKHFDKIQERKTTATRVAEQSLEMTTPSPAPSESQDSE